MTGIQKRLLNVSILDGGYGLMIKGRIPVRADMSFRVDKDEKGKAATILREMAG